MVFFFNSSFLLNFCFFIFISFNFNLTGLSTGRHIKSNTGAKTVLFMQKYLLTSVSGSSHICTVEIAVTFWNSILSI